MDWKKEYELGIPVIDSQHRQLFRFNDELQNAIKQGIKASSINTLMTQVKQYAARHFAIEERHMEELAYPKIEIQKKAHTAFVTRFLQIQDEFNEQGITQELIDMISNELVGWINDHITGMDQEFGDYYRRHDSAG